jgi:hypothetical protein
MAFWSRRPRLGSGERWREEIILSSASRTSCALLCTTGRANVTAAPEDLHPVEPERRNFGSIAIRSDRVRRWTAVPSTVLGERVCGVLFLPNAAHATGPAAPRGRHTH